MADPQRPEVYSIAAHRGFADALVAGLIPRYSEAKFGLARLTLLLPSRRAARTVTEAFVRASKGGLLLPRMATVGDLDIDEALGALFDPVTGDAADRAVVDPVRRWLRLAGLLRETEEYANASIPSLLRLARTIARSMDRLAIEEVAPADLLADRVADLFPDLAAHWQRNTRLFAVIQQRWRFELEERGEIEAVDRRNRLLDRVSRAWAAKPPEHPVIAAGITSAAPAIARLLRTVAGLPNGAMVLPDLDLELDEVVWSALGVAGAPAELGDPPFGREDAVTHPQYHLKVLLNRMAVRRDEVRPWHRSGPGAAPPQRSRAISNLFLPPDASAAWIALSADQRSLSDVRLMEAADPEEEAQAIALLAREALETPEKRVAIVTPDRALATRIVAHLQRWNIAADDSAGRPLSQTTAGRLLLALADCIGERFAPVPLLAALSHPLVRAGSERADWLERARRLDKALRGPRPTPDLAGVTAALAALDRPDPALAAWWAEIAPKLTDLQAEDGVGLAAMLDRLASAAEWLCGIALWSQPDGRALASFIENLRNAASDAATIVPPADLSAVLRDAMDEVAVRPPWGGHPRVAIYGLLEARLSRADLMICASMVEGKWPTGSTPDPLLAPPLLRALGVPGADFRIGLSAHDLASALGAPEVVLTRAARDEAGPTIPSRFLLRIEAMLGPTLAKTHRETDAIALARALDRAAPALPYPRPEPRPAPAQRRVALSATALDRLRGDPYQFYANAILSLQRLDSLDADPSAAWRGIAVHAILERWHEQGGDLVELGAAMLAVMNAHPFVKATWHPRLTRALAWIQAETARLAGEQRVPALWEKFGGIEIDGVRIHGKADRIDRQADGTLAIVDYKTGTPPSNAQVEQGFNLQLGVLGLIAARGGFAGVEGEPTRFEYWSLARSRDSATGFGFACEPIKEGRKQTGLPREEFVAQTEFFLRDAIARWIVGDEPFTARLNPDLPGYGDYDQLMRLDEWQARGDAASGA